MPTPFTDVYDVFFSQISDPILMANDTDDSLKFRCLMNAIPRFPKCKKDLSQRTETGFVDDLSDEEKLILGVLMVPEYFKPQISSLENIKQSMSNKDFNL